MVFLVHGFMILIFDLDPPSGLLICIWVLHAVDYCRVFFFVCLFG